MASDAVQGFIGNLRDLIKVVGNTTKRQLDAGVENVSNRAGSTIAADQYGEKTGFAPIDNLNAKDIQRTYSALNTISRKQYGKDIDPKRFMDVYNSGSNDYMSLLNQDTAAEEDNVQLAPGTPIDPYSPVTMNNRQAEGLQQPVTPQANPNTPAAQNQQLTESTWDKGGDKPVTSTGEAEAENPDDYVEYTYKRGDTFGQVIKDLGLGTNKGLWGSDGDVQYYTKQLREQGIPGMVPIGTKIRLKKRK